VGPNGKRAKKPGKQGSTTARGACKTAVNETSDCWQFAVVDNSQVVLLDNVKGTKSRVELKRRLKHSEKSYTTSVPEGFTLYNSKKGAIDVSDQLRAGFYSFEHIAKTIKWTLRLFEIVIGFCTASAWCIYLANH